MLHREAWPKTDIKSPEADSLFCRKFVDGILDIELQKYLHLHATSDDFDTTVSKASCRVLRRSQPSVQRRPASTTSPSSTECWRPWSVIEVAWRMSTLSRRPALLLPQATGTKRHRPAKDRRRQATRPPGVPRAVHRQPAARFGSRTRKMAEKATRATDHPAGAVGRATGLHKVTATVPGHGWIAVRQGKGFLAFSPDWRDGRHPRMVRVVRRHSREVSGCHGKGAHVLVPRPRAMQATGGPAGGHFQATQVVNRRFSNSIRRGRVAGARTQPTSSRRLLPICRRFADAMSVVTWDATPCSMGPTPCPHRHHRPWNASSAANEDVVRPATRQAFSHQRQVFQTSQQDQLRDQAGMQPIRSQTGSGARTRASGPRRPMYLHALSQIKLSLCLRSDAD